MSSATSSTTNASSKSESVGASHKLPPPTTEKGTLCQDTMTTRSPSKSVATELIASTFDNLHILQHIISFVGDEQYRFVAATNRRFQEAYAANFPGKKETTYSMACTEELAKLCWNEIVHRPYSLRDDEITLICCAASNGNLPIVKYLRDLECRWDYRTCAAAAENGHLNVLKWCRENGCPWDTSTCEAAARYGHLHVLQWCREHGCPWDAWTCEAAAQHGHLNVLKWCRENGCKWIVDFCIYKAGNHRHVVQWCQDNRGGVTF